MSKNIAKIMEITCAIQKYDWGKRGMQSKVASLYKNVNPEFVVDENTPYAELWLGTHMNGPSLVKGTGQPLSSVINGKPEYLGKEVLRFFGNELPFILKVLSINKALSIQVHPSKWQAAQLHSEKPNIYKDPNHKPELAIALTPFEALCGFRPIFEIRHFFKVVPELKEVVGKELIDQACCKEEPKESLRKYFTSLMTREQAQIASALKSALERFSKLGEEERREQCADLVERLYSQFPDDVGCFAVYFLNVIKLQPKEAIYLGANEPHAYLSGDCVECMACSDNVVRAGLTPKFKDVETLCSILNYQGEEGHLKIFKPVRENDFSQLFEPIVKDFAVCKIEIASEMNEHKLKVRNSPSIILVISGTADVDGVKMIPGSAIFIPVKQAVILKQVSSAFLAFQAMANV